MREIVSNAWPTANVTSRSLRNVLMAVLSSFWMRDRAPL
jgi:hypothetical protein